MSEERFSSAWDAIEDTPAETENLKLRSALMIALKEHIEHPAETQVEAARRRFSPLATFRRKIRFSATWWVQIAKRGRPPEERAGTRTGKG